ncbi:MAG: hypothetical protein IK152_00370 [Lachnospiraceae bacterium]|nr:hypothetical protein [Lachnospiraceae bacterium]
MLPSIISIIVYISYYFFLRYELFPDRFLSSGSGDISFLSVLPNVGIVFMVVSIITIIIMLAGIDHKAVKIAQGISNVAMAVIILVMLIAGMMP